MKTVNTLAGERLRRFFVKPVDTNSCFGRHAAWLMWAVSLVFVVFQFTLQFSMGELLPSVMHHFSLNAMQAGLVLSSYYYVYIALQVPAGMLMDRFGPRRLLSLGGVVCAVGCCLFALAHSVELAVIGRLLMGAGASFAFVGTLFIIGHRFEASRFALMIGLTEMLGFFGSAMSNSGVALLLKTLSYSNVMLLAGLTAVLLGFMAWVVMRDSTEASNDDSQQRVSFWFGLNELIKKPVVWCNAIFSGFMFSVVTVFVSLWAIPFLVKAHHVSLLQAAELCSWVFVGAGIACPLIGWLDNYISSRRLLMAMFAIISAVFMLAVLEFVGLSLLSMQMLMFCLGFFCSTYTLSYTIGHELATPATRGVSAGIVNTFCVIMAPLFQPVVGKLLDYLSHHHCCHLADYSVHSYQVSLLIVPAMMMFSAVLAIFLPNRKDYS